MKSTKDIQFNDRIFACFIGPPGSGKSVGAGSFPGPIYWFDFDGRMKPIRKMFPDRTDIDYDTYKADDYDKFARDMDVVVASKRYKTVVLDSLTMLGDMLLQYSAGLRGRAGMTRGKIQLLEVEDYGVETRGLTKIIDLVRDLENTHVILTAHWLVSSSYDITKQKEVISRTVMTGGKKIAAKVPAWFDEVWSFHTEPGVGINDPVKYLVSTAPTSAGVGFAKTALPLPNRIDFTMPKSNLWKEIEASLKGVK